MSFLHHWNRKIATIVGTKGQSIETARSRLMVIGGVCLVMFAVIIIRIGDLTLLQKPREPQTDAVVSQAGGFVDRADIVDRNGVLLATTLQVASLYADPALIPNKPFVARELNRILGIDNADAKLNRKGRFVWIKRGITPDQHFAVNALGQPGLGFRMETKRFYPQGHLASHLVGYTDVDGKGLAGIELQYNDRLQRNPQPLVLNMDVRIQHSLVKSLRAAMEKFDAKAASGGVVDVETGEIIAVVSLPDFDPHHVGKATDVQKFNHFSLGVYEMGSTFKLFSTANFIEETGKPFSFTLDAREPLKEGRFTINDYHAQRRVMTVPEVFIHSSNIGSALMGRMTGTAAMQNFYRDLGFLNVLDIDYPAKGVPLTPSPWRDINTLTAAYGHGIAVTPLHVLRATAAMVNGGIVPDLSIARPEDTEKRDAIRTRILSASTAHKMRQLLRLNVTEGSGQKADVAGYMVGGKTGTSEKVGGNGYDKHKLLSSFIGVFPANAPRYAVLAILDEPKGTKDTYGYATGGWTGAPVVGDVIGDMATILGIAPVVDDGTLTAGLERYVRDKENGYSPASYQ